MAKAKSKAAAKTLSWPEGVFFEVLSDFEKYLPSPQDVALYRRKLGEYIEEIGRRLNEPNMPDEKAGGVADYGPDSNE